MLDLGLRTGDYSLFFAERGADVTAVDYSDVAIDQLHAVCATAASTTSIRSSPTRSTSSGSGRSTSCSASGSCTISSRSPSSRDVCASSLVDDGRGFFYENNGLSGALLWARAHLAGKYGIPKFGDDEEFPLTPDEIEELRRYFDVEVDVAETYLAQLGSQYLLRSHLMGAAAKTDGFVHERLPRLRRYSYRQNLLLRARPQR